MLAVIFELGIDWYINKDKCSSTANDMFYSDILIHSPVGQYRYYAQKCNVKITSS